MLLLHGFGEFWWAWRHQLPVLDAAGRQCRRLGSAGLRRDRQDPPRLPAVGHRAPTSRRVIRSLGFSSAYVIGHDWGGVAAWSTYAYAPEQVSGLATIAAPHPLRFPWRSMGPGLVLVPAADPARARDHGPRRCVRGVAAATAGRGTGRRSCRPTTRGTTGRRCGCGPARTAPWSTCGCSAGTSSARAGRDFRQVLRSPVRVPVLTVRGSADRAADRPRRCCRRTRTRRPITGTWRSPTSGTCRTRRRRTRCRRRCWTGCPPLIRPSDPARCRSRPRRSPRCASRPPAGGTRRPG